ncbi:MAG: U32 family peptidase [Bdellovibrionales bacterium]|jgi:collagenase-like PrtC family protease
MPSAKLTLGPLFYNWPPEKKRDFYFRIADEAPIDCVYVGEVVCSKREPFFNPYLDEVLERLEKAGKQVVVSSLALLTLPREMEALREKASGDRLVEANDVSALQLLKGKPFIVGPMINVMNEGTLAAMAARGAVRVVFASEMSGKAIGTLANYSSSLRGADATQTPPSYRRRPVSSAARLRGKRLLCAADDAQLDPAFQRDDDCVYANQSPKPHPIESLQTEVQVSGRQSLALSMRCYHARAHGRDKDHCRKVCENDPDGLDVDTITGQPILSVNGTQTLTRGYVVLLNEMHEMAEAGVTHFRLSPQNCDMVSVSRIYRNFLDALIDPESALSSLKTLMESVTFINGFYHGKEGKSFVSIP